MRFRGAGLKEDEEDEENMLPFTMNSMRALADEGAAPHRYCCDFGRHRVGAYSFVGIAIAARCVQRRLRMSKFLRLFTIGRLPHTRWEKPHLAGIQHDTAALFVSARSDLLVAQSA